MSHAIPSTSGAPPADAPLDDEPITDPYASELSSPPEVRLGKLVYDKRLEFLANLLACLDTVIYVHICYLYLLDCNFLRFFASCAVQWLFLSPITITPKPPCQSSKTVLVTVGMMAVLCVLWHCWAEAPSAGEETEGYLHGGMIIDFVGQKGPTSKARLVVNDLVVLVLQVMMHCVVMIRQRIPAYGDVVVNKDATPRDLDDMERGVRRRRWNLDGSPSGEGGEVDEWDQRSEEERVRLELEHKTFRVAGGDFLAARIDVADAIRRMATDDGEAGSGATPAVTVERAGRSWRLRVTGNLRTS